MSKAFRYLVSIGISVSAFALVGCGKCTQNASGGVKCESGQPYVGTPTEKDVAWAPGQNLTIDVHGGNVRVGETAATSIHVVQGTATGTMHVTFTPVIFLPASEEASARSQLSNNLDMSAQSNADGLLVAVAPKGTHDSSLSARVDITLPAGFDGLLTAHAHEGGNVSVQTAGGSVNADTSSGDILIDGPRKSVIADSAVGNITVKLGGAVDATASGKLTTKLGDITFGVPSASDITIMATAEKSGGVFISPSTLPTGWQLVSGSTATAATLTANQHSAASWVLDASQGVASKVNIDIL